MFLGRIADLYGRKRIFLIGTVILGAFGLACGFAQSSSTLYDCPHSIDDFLSIPLTDEFTLFILRGLQGIGGAAVIPASVRTLYPGKRIER